MSFDVDFKSNSISVKKLADLADLISGANIPSENRRPDGVWQLIRGRNIIDSSVVESDVFIDDQLAKKNAKSVIVPGDILISTQFEQYKIGIVPKEFPPALADRGVMIIRPKNIQKEYLHKYLVSKTGKNALVGQLAQVVRGGVIKFVTKSDLATLDIPLLPESLLISENESLDQLRQINIAYERQILEFIKDTLLKNGWKKEQIVLESFVSSGIRADIALKKNGKVVAIVEVKRVHKDPQYALQMLKSMADRSRVSKAYLVSGDGLVEFDATNGNTREIVSLPKEEEFV